MEYENFICIFYHFKRRADAGCWERCAWKKMTCFYYLGKSVTADHLARCVTRRIRGNGIDPVLPEYADLNTSTIYLPLGNRSESFIN